MAKAKGFENSSGQTEKASIAMVITDGSQLIP